MAPRPPSCGPPLRNSSVNFSNSFSILYFSYISIFQNNNYITHLFFYYRVKREIKNALAQSILLEIQKKIINREKEFKITSFYYFQFTSNKDANTSKTYHSLRKFHFCTPSFLPDTCSTTVSRLKRNYTPIPVYQLLR